MIHESESGQRAMTEKPKKWTIKRWSGHDNDVPKFRYIDS
jgi:hypothetical protein